MNKAYIILAHKNPGQLLRLVERLNDNSSRFFIHIDQRVPISGFINKLAGYKNLIEFTKRENSSWGGLGLVKATLNGLSLINDKKSRFDYISLVSGQDYPIKKNDYINNFFEKNSGKNFIKYTMLPNPNWGSGGLNRITYYHFGDRSNPGIYQKTIGRLLNLALTRFDFLKRKFPDYLIPFGGSQWWDITDNALKYILHFVDKHPDYIKFHKYSMLPDELFFQTILLNTIDDQLKNSIVNDYLRYIDWSKPQGPYPPILTMVDFENIKNSDKLYARKFDEFVDREVMDMIDNHCLK